MRSSFGRAMVKILTGVALSLGAPAHAYDWYVDAYVTIVQPTYMPAYVSFQIDSPGGSCAAGSFLNWPAQGPDMTAKNLNTQAVYTTLLTAKATHTKVRIFGNNSGCTVDYMWLL